MATQEQEKVKGPLLRILEKARTSPQARQDREELQRLKQEQKEMVVPSIVTQTVENLVRYEQITAGLRLRPDDPVNKLAEGFVNAAMQRVQESIERGNPQNFSVDANEAYSFGGIFGGTLNHHLSGIVYGDYVLEGFQQGVMENDTQVDKRWQIMLKDPKTLGTWAVPVDQLVRAYPVPPHLA